MAKGKVVVTGGSGLAGSFIVEHLVREGYVVLNVDIVPPKQDIAPYKLVDLTDLGQVYGALAGAEKVVHFGAIPRPVYHTPDVVFRTNVMSTFNVMEASVGLGIRRVVYASSMSFLGYPFNYQHFEPLYAPVDEDHPSGAQDAYALSKYLGEEIAKAFVRRSGNKLSVISLRLGWIHTPESFKRQITPLLSDLDGAKYNIWVYIDARDAAHATQLALESPLTGHEAFFIVADDNFTDQPTADLIRRYFPSTEIRDDLEGRQSLLSNAKAKRLLGWQPQYSWSEY